VRAAAQFDAATVLIGLQDWPAAARALEDFRRTQTGHPLQAEVAPKLVLAYEALDRPEAAAGELERVAAAPGQSSELARSALWRAAELRARAAKGTPPRSALRAGAIQAHERLLALAGLGFEAGVEARSRLAGLLQADGLAARAQQALQAVRQADAEGGAQRTARTRTLGGQAALALAEPAAQACRAVALVEPLARQLKLKKARFEDALRAYGLAAEVGVVEISTQATFRTAALYQDFGSALTTSARPKKLNKAELEQYNVMLEEQAFPFEEQAIALFEANARRATEGVYDQAVRDSYAELARLKPARWGKTERSDANALNQQGIAQRQAGRFDEARRAFEAAIAKDAAAVAPQLNLGILQDLYLGDASAATTQYQRALALSPEDAPLIQKWLAELKTRKPPTASNSPPLSTTAATAAPKEPS
jgi:tetratricopeptide (TPR) repeat protein